MARSQSKRDAPSGPASGECGSPQSAVAGRCLGEIGFLVRFVGARSHVGRHEWLQHPHAVAAEQSLQKVFRENEALRRQIRDTLSRLRAGGLHVAVRLSGEGALKRPHLGDAFLRLLERFVTRGEKGDAGRKLQESELGTGFRVTVQPWYDSDDGQPAPGQTDVATKVEKRDELGHDREMPASPSPEQQQRDGLSGESFSGHTREVSKRGQGPRAPTEAERVEAARKLALLKSFKSRVLTAIKPFRTEFKGRVLPELEGQGFYEQNPEAAKELKSILLLLGMHFCDPSDPTTTAHLTCSATTGTLGGNLVLRSEQSAGRPRANLSSRTTLPDRLTAVED